MNNLLKWIYDFVSALSTGILPVQPKQSPVPKTTYDIKLNYDRSEPESSVYLLLTAADPIPDLKGMTQSVPITVADFRKANPSMTVTLGDTNGGRLYVGINEFPLPTKPGLAPAPLPTGDQYYGWVEFTRLASDNCVWSNLSNVDVVALPLTMTGTEVGGSPFSLGYKTPVSLIQKSLAMKLGKCDAVVSCTGPSGPYTKIVGPNNVPSSYPSYQTYLKGLCKAGAKLNIDTDVPGGTYSGPEVFTGSFTTGKTAIKLTGSFGDTFAVNLDQLTDAIIYSCAGGTLIWNGKTVDQNDVPAAGGTQTPSQILHNSLFRKICVGLNEGYFVSTGTNFSSNFPYFTPFVNAPGSEYADVIHEDSNSYGFPYSDSNLKVQALAERTSTITLNIIGDNVAQDYTDESGPNILTSGKYQFGIGGNSNLGVITFGNCRYVPTSGGAYGGFLPTVDDWYAIYFGEDDHYIWLKTPENGGPDIECGNAFVAAPQWQSATGATGLPSSTNLVWGASVVWNPGATAPAKPTR